MRWIDAFVPGDLAARDHTAARVLVGLAWGLAAATPLGLALRLMIGSLDPMLLGIVGVSSAIFAAVPWLLRTTGSLRLAGIVLNLSLLVLILSSGWYAGGLGGPVMTIAPLLPLAATFLFGGRFGFAVTILLTLALGTLFALSIRGVELPRPELTERGELIARSLFLAITVVLAALFAGLYHRQRSAAEEQLRRSRDLYRRLFEQSKDAVALTTRDGHVLDLNPAGVELFGYRSKNDASGVDVSSLYADPDQRRELLQRLEAHGHVRDYESRVRTRSGKIRVVEGTTSTIRGESGGVEYLLAILRDVTEKRRAEAEREALLAELTVKNRDLRQFGHTVSHDLKGPVSTIRGFIELLRRDLRAERYGRADDLIDSIRKGTDGMNKIIDGLMQLGEIGRSKVERRQVALGEIAREATSLLAARITAAGATVDVVADMPAVEGDPQLLLTVFQNLIDNGIKYSSHRGAPGVKVSWRRDGDGAVFTVADNGRGIDPKHRRQVFEPFRQLRPEDEGAGLGLASVRRAIEAHGGRVWIESEGEGRGATVCFTVPPRSDSEILDLGDQRQELAGLRRRRAGRA